MPEEIFSPAQIQDYEAARDVLARRIREILLAAEACTDATERLRLEDAVSELSRRRGALSVGSEEVAALLAEDAPPSIPRPRGASARPAPPLPRSS